MQFQSNNGKKEKTFFLLLFGPDHSFPITSWFIHPVAHRYSGKLWEGNLIPQLVKDLILYSFVLCFEKLVQFSSVAQSCATFCDPMNRSTPGLPVHHQNPEFTQTHVHRVSDAIQPSHPLASPSCPAPNPSQHQSLSQSVNSSHEVAKVLEFQL